MGRCTIRRNPCTNSLSLDNHCWCRSLLYPRSNLFYFYDWPKRNFDNWDTGSDGYIDETVEYTEYQVGDSVDFSDGLHVTVTSMGKDDSVELVDSYYSTAYVVEMEVENSTAEELYFDEYYFSLMDPVSQIPFSLDLRTYDVNLVEKLKPGEKVQVKLIYGIDDETNFGFTYEDAMWTELVAEGI